MKSPKSRSRNNKSRNRSAGNIINRVFESSGPEGKVRGTPQQIIDKYNQLARDSRLAENRVATENFQQYAEHYTRLLMAAQKEIDARREQIERDAPARDHRDAPARDHRDAPARDPREGSPSQTRPAGDGGGHHRSGARGGAGANLTSTKAADDPDGRAENSDDIGLVDTPEARAEVRHQARSARRMVPQGGAVAAGLNEPEPPRARAPRA